jgi:hypothetical protein
MREAVVHEAARKLPVIAAGPPTAEATIAAAAPTTQHPENMALEPNVKRSASRKRPAKTRRPSALTAYNHAKPFGQGMKRPGMTFYDSDSNSSEDGDDDDKDSDEAIAGAHIVDGRGDEHPAPPNGKGRALTTKAKTNAASPPPAKRRKILAKMTAVTPDACGAAAPPNAHDPSAYRSVDTIRAFAAARAGRTLEPEGSSESPVQTLVRGVTDMRRKSRPPPLPLTFAAGKPADVGDGDLLFSPATELDCAHDAATSAAYNAKLIPSRSACRDLGKRCPTKPWTSAWQRKERATVSNTGERRMGL